MGDRLGTPGAVGFFYSFGHPLSTLLHATQIFFSGLEVIS